MNVLADRRCKRVRNRISEVVLSDEQMDASDEKHSSTCLQCQAEIAQFRAISREFAALRQEIATAPPDLVARVMTGLDRTALPWFRRPVAMSVSAASAVAVAATVAFALRRRHVAA